MDGAGSREAFAGELVAPSAYDPKRSDFSSIASAFAYPANAIKRSLFQSIDFDE